MHSSWITRPPTQDDFEAVRQLIEGCLKAYYGVPSFEADRLEKLWATDGFNMATDAWVVVGSEGELKGYADVMHATAEQIFVAVYVEQVENDAAISDQLRDVAEKRVRNHPEKPATIKCRVSDLNTSLMAALSHAGHARYLSFLTMERVLEAPPEPSQWADGITVRNFVPGQDDHATYLVDEAASQDKGYYHPMTFKEWSERVNLNGDNFDAGLWWLACSGEEIVGVAINVLHPSGTQGWVDHLGVLRQWRKKGIGKALMLQSFGEFYRRGVKTMKLNVDSESLTNAPRLYEDVGMETVQQYHWYEKAHGAT